VFEADNFPDPGDQGGCRNHAAGQAVPFRERLEVPHPAGAPDEDNISGLLPVGPPGAICRVIEKDPADCRINSLQASAVLPVFWPVSGRPDFERGHALLLRVVRSDIASQAFSPKGKSRTVAGTGNKPEADAKSGEIDPALDCMLRLSV
jgi:hypothetical protein